MINENERQEITLEQYHEFPNMKPGPSVLTVSFEEGFLGRSLTFV